MKKILLILVVLAVMTLSACSLTQYFPNTTNESPVIVLNDSFTIEEEPEEQQDVSVDISEDEPQEDMPEEDMEESQGDFLTTVTVTEGETADISFLAAQDPDGDTIDFTYGTPFNTLGRWVTEDGDEGTYEVSITASDGVLSTTEEVRVIVQASNKAPVIDCPEVFSVDEGETIELPCTVFDAEGDNFTFSVSGFMDSFEQETDFEDAGEYEVLIEATDGNRESSKEVSILIADVNRAPVVDALDTITVTEGEFVVLDIDANDPDGDTVSVDYPILFDEDGIWETTRGDAGNYNLEAEVSDGEAVTTVAVSIVVEKLNLAPTIDNLDDVTVEEGETITLSPDFSDPDGDEIFIQYAGFMTENTYTTTYDDAGVYEVTVSVTDGRLTTEETITITVENKNRPPVFVVN